ncbi:hypothetical protein [Fenollaria timonensis]|uniref:hypothetical protein n=1 Tax=Fenollaria timonensis TaxID=1723384 RepID=UPI0026EB5B0F|nr:hypothetical protein [Fenollaria timonensis]
MKIDFYYWGNICPISTEIINLMSEYEEKIDIYLHDISNDRESCKINNIFFPFLTVLNDINRYYSPISRKFMEEIAVGIIPKEKPFIPKLGTKIISETIKPIRKDNYKFASKCTSRKNCLGCASKIEMYNSMNEEIYGFINVLENKLLGGAEYVPSKYVPYDIPKNDDIAFITCVYLSNKEYDYKSAPLIALENYLRSNYKKVLVISDELGVFPNGNLDFFMKNNYIDEGIIFEDSYCKLHLMSKLL